MKHQFFWFYLVLLILPNLPTQAQGIFNEYKKKKEQSFKSYQNTKQKEFNEYRIKKNLEFAKYIANKWETIQVFKGYETKI